MQGLIPLGHSPLTTTSVYNLCQIYWVLFSSRVIRLHLREKRGQQEGFSSGLGKSSLTIIHNKDIFQMIVDGKIWDKPVCWSLIVVKGYNTPHPISKLTSSLFVPNPLPFKKLYAISPTPHPQVPPKPLSIYNTEPKNKTAFNCKCLCGLVNRSKDLLKVILFCHPNNKKVDRFCTEFCSTFNTSMQQVLQPPTWKSVLPYIVAPYFFKE